MQNLAAVSKKWKLDTNHSLLSFKIKHLGLAWISGAFQEYEGTVEVEDFLKFEEAKISLRIEVDSLNSGNDMRDNHLKTEEFFDSLLYPSIIFNSTSIKKQEANIYQILGELTLKDVTKEVQFSAEIVGSTVDMWGNHVVVLRVVGSLNRQDFGIAWHHILDGGLPVIGEEVNFDMNIELIPGED